MKHILFGMFVVLFLLPLSAFANGGDQRVLGQDYLVNLSRSPFTPVVGTKTAMTVSFVDLKTVKLITDDLLVSVRVGKGRGSKTFIYEQKDIPVKGGVLEWSYMFAEPGLHELFFDFAFAGARQKIYAPPDFLLDVQPVSQTPVSSGTIVFGGVAIITVLALGFLLGRKSRR